MSVIDLRRIHKQEIAEQIVNDLNLHKGFNLVSIIGNNINIKNIVYKNRFIEALLYGKEMARQSHWPNFSYDTFFGMIAKHLALEDDVVRQLTFDVSYDVSIRGIKKHIEEKLSVEMLGELLSSILNGVWKTKYAVAFSEYDLSKTYDCQFLDVNLFSEVIKAIDENEIQLRNNSCEHLMIDDDRIIFPDDCDSILSNSVGFNNTSVEFWTTAFETLNVQWTHQSRLLFCN